MKSFLGLVGYYQRFIPGFATLASPLNDLTQMVLPDRVTWSEAAEGAFATLRLLLRAHLISLKGDILWRFHNKFKHII